MKVPFYSASVRLRWTAGLIPGETDQVAFWGAILKSVDSAHGANVLYC